MPGGRRPNSRSKARLAETQSERDFYARVRDRLIELANEYVLLEGVRGRRSKSVKRVSNSAARSPGIAGPDRTAGRGRRPRLRAG